MSASSKRSSFGSGNQLKQQNCYNIVVLGRGGVGKSALTIQFIQAYFVTDYDPTIEDSYSKQMIIDSELARLDILDTAGQDEFLAMQEQHFRTADGFLIVFALDDSASLEEASELLKKIKRSRDDGSVNNSGRLFSGILVGNKSDLINRRCVSSRDAEAFAHQLGLAYIETSAKARVNVDAAFAELVRQIRTRRQQEQQSNGGRKKDRFGKGNPMKSSCVIL